MTSKQMFEYALVELNKREAPSLLLEDYNYFINKAVNQYINKVYNAYDVNQQKSDDLRVLKATAIIEPSKSYSDPESLMRDKLFGNIYSVDLPDDYLHILNCVVEYKVNKTYKCYNAGSTWSQGARRLTADMFSQIINNYYLRPTYKNPYFYINNVNTKNDFPTEDSREEITFNSYIVPTIVGKDGTISFKIGDGDTPTNVSVSSTDSLDAVLDKIVTALGSSIKKKKLSGGVLVYAEIKEPSNCTVDNSVERAESTSYGNRSKVRMELRYGKDDKIFEPEFIYVDYLKAPQFIRLTQDEIDQVEDTSQVLEFPDYVCQEIVNELIRLLMENASDPRLQTHIPINQSIANPQQEQAPKNR